MRLNIHLKIFTNLRNKFRITEIEDEKTNLIKDGVELFKVPKSENLIKFVL